MIKYRPDIDALRAIAVVPVVLFHADVSLFEGGFVGVDVFFVISGFLISSIILAETEAGTFSIASFYYRRILRIFPALVIVLLAVLAAGWVLYAPDDYKRLSESVFAASTFLSNFYFLKDSGYFGVAPEAKPLLHTWSLAVEEQFYIVFPLYLVAIARLSRDAKAALTLALWGVSLMAAAVMVQRDATFAFFMLPTRMWELMTGTLLALGTFAPARSRALALAGFWVGLALILAAMLTYGERMAFPGLAAVPPVVGTGLVIWAGLGSPDHMPGFMASRLMVLGGKISYPLYLWHFPAIAIAKYASVGPASPLAVGTAVAVSVILAAATWQMIEVPLQKAGRRAGARATIGIGVAAISATAALGLLGYVNRGFEWRIAPDRLALVQGLTDRWPQARACLSGTNEAISRGDICVLGGGTAKPEVAVWGDSFAEALAPGMAQAADGMGKRFHLLGQHGCTPSLGDGVGPGEGDCAAISRAAFGWIAAQSGVKTVVLALRWPSGLPTERRKRHQTASPDRFTSQLEALALALVARGKTVWITGPLPVFPYNVPRALYVRSLGLGNDEPIRVARADYDAEFGWSRAAMGRLAGLANVHVVVLDGSLCGPTGCAAISDGRPLYFDDNHLSAFAARGLSPQLAPVFR